MVTQFSDSSNQLFHPVLMTVNTNLFPVTLVYLHTHTPFMLQCASVVNGVTVLEFMKGAEISQAVENGNKHRHNSKMTRTRVNEVIIFISGHNILTCRF